MPGLNYSFRDSPDSGKIHHSGSSYVFEYPCSSSNECDPYKVSFFEGFYTFECWGGDGNSGGKGGYTRGTIHFSSAITLYFHLGATVGKYNGVPPNAEHIGGCFGGGSTDIRLSDGPYYDFESLKTRIIVSGGAGSQDYHLGYGMNGGGLVGDSGITNMAYGGVNPLNWVATGGNQTSGGIGSEERFVSGSFGLAGYLTSTSDWGAFGGGGYYGGASVNIAGISSGGSSFISGHPGCLSINQGSSFANVIHNDHSYHYSGHIFTSTVMYGGNDISIMPHNPTTLHGSIRVTPLHLLELHHSCIRYNINYISLFIAFFSLFVC